MNSSIIECEGILVSLAEKFRYSIPALDRDDLIQEGWHEVYKAQKKYDQSRGAISTWVYQVVYSHFLNLCNRKKGKMLHASDKEPELFFLQIPCNKMRPDKRIEWVDDLHHLSPLALYIVEMSFNEAEEFSLEGSETFRKVRGLIRKHLFEKGYTQRQISTAFQEIRDFLKDRER